MKAKNDFFNSRKIFVLRVILAVVLSLATGVAGAMPTLPVSAAGLTRIGTSGLLTGDVRIEAATLADIDDFPGAAISNADLPYQDLNLDVSGATPEAGDPNSIQLGDCDSNQGELSVWYHYNPGSQSAYVSFDTIGSLYDTVLIVWTGVPGSLTLVACNDDISKIPPFVIQSQVKLLAQANTTYYIEIIKFKEPAPAGLEALASEDKLNFHAKKLNYVINPPSLNFGNQLYRNWTATKTVTYTSYDALPVQLGTLSITDSYSKQTMFLKNNTCNNVTLDFGDSCTFGIAFLPWAAGAITGLVTIPSNALDQPYYVNLNGKGILGISLVKNFSFEIDKNKNKLPDLWSASKLTKSLDMLTAKFPYHKTYSMKFVGQNPARVKTLTQVINKNGVAGDDFYMQAWSKASKAPKQGVRFFVYWYDGTKLVGKRSMIWGKGTYNFKTQWKAYTAPAKYTRIVIKISYTQASGMVWLDQVTFRWAPSPK
jgi:hypothetical protein